MKKQLFCTIVFVFVYAVCFCQQENEYVEVLVQDTVKLDADEIIFSVIIRDDIAVEDVTDNAVNTNNKKNNKIIQLDHRIEIKSETEQAIQRLIAKQQIDTIPVTQYILL
jgi:hypothetical protein